MNKRKTICFISDGYPYKDSNHCVFVRELVSKIANDKNECIVICPQMYYPKRQNKLPEYFEDCVNENKVIKVYAPVYLHVSSKPLLMGISSANHYHAVLSTLIKADIKPDAVYGHFIYHNGLTAIKIAQYYHCASFIACGENTLRLEKNSKPYATGLKYHKWRKKLKQVSAMICVSSVNKNMLIQNGFIDKNVKVFVLPNAVDTTVFKPYDKKYARNKLGYSHEAFIVSFVGTFCDRKGNKRVDDSIKDDKDICSIFIGRGEAFSPKSNCLFCGSVNHRMLPLYLSAADCFVLPTTGEGCCNAIIEAFCCGLPIISSKNSFNDDILNDNYSLRIDPNNQEEIKKAIYKLKTDNHLCNEMHIAALDAAKDFSLEYRANKIWEIICNEIK